MGNALGSSKAAAAAVERPEQFVSQAKIDWDEQFKHILRAQPTLTKSVILPAGVQLDDPRLAQGTIVHEERYTLEPDQVDADSKAVFPEDVPFEVDVSGKLVPPAWGKKGTPAHYLVYPTERFANVSRCEFCTASGTSTNPAS